MHGLYIAYSLWQMTHLLVVYVGVGFMGLLAIIFLVFAVILRKRRILAEMEVIDDWGVFANDESDAIFEN